MPTYQELQKLIKNEPESTTEDPTVDEPVEAEQLSADDVKIIEELVYPYEMTLGMLKQYRQFTSMNMDKDINRIYNKLYRSARYWRLEPHQYKWLIRKMR